jgi:hypothetical protein
MWINLREKNEKGSFSVASVIVVTTHLGFREIFDILA